MKVYTYYEDINLKHQNRLIDLWKNSWEKHGFEAIILNRVDAEKHPFCKEFIQILGYLHQLITMKPLSKYGLSCWLRWLAYAAQSEEKFYVSDYDVINHNFEPVEPEDVLHLMDEDCPCIASGTPSQFNQLCNMFVKVPEDNLEYFIKTYYESKFVHYHDQEFFTTYLKQNKDSIKATRRRELFLGIPGQAEFWKKQLVHYGHNLCNRLCVENGIEFNEEERCNIVEKYIKYEN